MGRQTGKFEYLSRFPYQYHKVCIPHDHQHRDDLHMLALGCHIDDSEIGHLFHMSLNIHPKLTIGPILQI